MADQRSPHDVIEVDISELPFYRSMEVVQENTGLQRDQLLLNNAGFKAIPEACVCGHEWSVFDIVINAIDQEEHDWAFFTKALAGETGRFFYRKTDLTCPCGITSVDVSVLYNYSSLKVRGWGY